MSQTFRILHEGREVGTISAESLEHCKRVKDYSNLLCSQFIDDPQMIKMAENGKTAFVLTLAHGYSAERIP
jgi:hypothetical protein